MTAEPASPSRSTPANAPPPVNERALLLTLAAVQFANVLDFMVMMPLGASIMTAFQVTPQAFSWLVAAYGTAAAISGFAGGFVLDRFDRKNALLVLFVGFTLATLACALAPNYLALLVARLAAGTFGGVAGSVVTAMVGDVIPPHRRGRAMSTVMSAFPLASIAGIPLSLALVNWFEWHAPFFLLAGLSAVLLPVIAKVLPHVSSHRHEGSAWQQMREILSHPVHQRGFTLGATLIFAGACIVPFMAPSLVKNVGLSDGQLPWVYFVGGTCTFFTMPLLGRLSDRHDKFVVLLVVTVPAVAAMLTMTHLGPSPLPWALAVSALFFVGMSSRFPPTMAMITNAVEGRYRGGFMSVMSAIQQAAGGLGNVVAGFIVTAGPDGRLQHFDRAGWVSCGAFGLTVLLAARLRSIAPHAARNPAHHEIAAASPPSAGPAADCTCDDTPADRTENAT